MSSTRSVLLNYVAIDAESMGADITGPTTTISYQDQVCYQVSWLGASGSAIGTIAVQGSVDNVTFHDITFTPALTQPNADDGGYLINMALVPFTYIRVKYTRSSGTGTLTVKMSTKGN